MELVGLIHDLDYIYPIQKYLDKTFKSIDSLMLELPPEIKHEKHHEFFLRLKDTYSKRGIKIIYGDINCVEPSQEFMANLSEMIGTRKKMNSNKFGKLCSIMSEMMVLYWDNFYSKKRDEGMLKSIYDNNPDLIIVGSAHGDYLKTKIPELKYTRIEDSSLNLSKSFLFKILTNNFHSPNPDKCVELKDLEKQFRYFIEN